MTDSTARAIQSALNQNWAEAIVLNQEIIKTNKRDVDALNRLGFAYLQSGKFSDARATFTKVTKIDPYNHIAQRNLTKLNSIKRKDLDKTAGSNISPLLFLEEPGITKIATCINPAPLGILSTLTAGQEVTLKAKNHCVEIRDRHNTYLGALPDDLSFRMIKLIKTGNTYKTYVKGFGKNKLTIFIREHERDKKLGDQPSFLTPMGFIAGGAETNSGSEKPDMTPTGEENELSGREDETT